ncbi:MAG: response regulator, partial [Paracoccaceae bacterium]
EKAAVTSQMSAEEAMREHRNLSELLTQIMDTAKSAIIALGSNGEILSINSTGRHFLGGLTQTIPFAWPKDVSFIDRETLQPFESSKDPVATSLAGTSLNGDIYSMTNTNDSDSRYVRISSATVDTERSAVKCVLILDDVSEQEKNRQQVERTSRLDALGQLTGGIAHDFNNLLTTVQYSLDLAQTADTTARHTYLETAKQSVARGSDLTKRLLAFAKQQPGLSTSNEVDSIITEFRKLCAPLIEATIEIEFVTQEDDLWVYCDTGQLGNALLNMVLNARDAILRSGVGNKITILVRAISELHVDATLRREQSNTYVAKGLYAENSINGKRANNSAFRYVEFAVTDNGPGMSDEVKRRAIDPFFTTKETNSGTGLGLSMVYGFIQQSNGELRIYSEPEQGTTIRMLLPRGTALGTREEPLAREELTKGQGERILIVEDEIRLAIVVRDLIKSLGYTVETASNGAEALAILDQGDNFDLVITDIVMPGEYNGFQLAEKIQDRIPDMPLIYMSGYTAYSDEDMGKVVAPMLQKPCPQSELAVAIRKAMASRG